MTPRNEAGLKSSATRSPIAAAPTMRFEDADLSVSPPNGRVPRQAAAAYKRLMAEPVMVDLRNVFSPDEMAEHGFTYVSVGRSAIERKVRRSHQLADLAYLCVSAIGAAASHATGTEHQDALDSLDKGKRHDAVFRRQRRSQRLSQHHDVGTFRIFS